MTNQQGSAPGGEEARRFDRAVDMVLDGLTDEARSGFWAFIDGTITEDEFMQAIR